MYNDHTGNIIFEAVVNKNTISIRDGSNTTFHGLEIVKFYDQDARSVIPGVFKD